MTGRGTSRTLEAEWPLFLRYMASEHARIGLDAFATRTEPVFPDR